MSDSNNTVLKYHPLVTILIPVYNGSRFVKDAIDSALAQTYDNFEILVVNDGSTDNTEEVLKEYGNKIRFISKPNGGVSTALNVGIENMRGEWLSWLSHDDRYLPNKLLHQVQKLNEIMDCGVDIKKVILYCNNERIDVNGNFISKKGHIYDENESIKDSMLNNIRHYNICGCAVLVPKHAFDAVGGFRVEIPTCSDADMWYRMMFAGYRFVFMNEVLVQSRQHQGQVSKKKQAQCEKEQNDVHCEIASKLLEYLDSAEDVWKLECYLIQRGFEPAAQIVLRYYNEKYRSRSKIAQYIILNAYRAKHFVRNILRVVYRKITSR